MSSPYPLDAETLDDKQIYAMKQASIWLSRVNEENTEVSVSEVCSQLDSDRDAYEENYLEKHLHDVAIDDYLWNHPDKVKELFRTDSLDKKISILNDARSTVMGRFGRYKPEKPSYDELEDMILTAVKDAKESNSQLGEYYDKLDV